MPTRNIRSYYALVKPGIVYSNALVAFSAFIFASHGSPINWLALAHCVIGLSCIVASGCVCNNVFDKDIDARMARTATRPIPRGSISKSRALIFGGILGILGAIILLLGTNLFALGAALVGWVVYVALYTPLKHKSGYALYVGAVAGAMPPVVGYSAVTNTLDLTALWLFLFLFVWQLPHFIAIAMYRYDEYAAAGVPLLIQKPSPKAAGLARKIFFATLVVLLLWCALLILW